MLSGFGRLLQGEVKRVKMNKNVLKLWIIAYLGMISIIIYSFVMLLEGKLEFTTALILGGMGVMMIYYLVLKDEIEKMRTEYEKAGSLKKTVKMWRDGDK